MSGMRSKEFGEASSSSSPSRSTSSSMHNFFRGESSSSSSFPSFSSGLCSLPDALLFDAMQMHQPTADHFANTGMDDSRFCEIFNRLNIKGKSKVENELDPLGTVSPNIYPRFYRRDLNHGGESEFSNSIRGFVYVMATYEQGCLDLRRIIDKGTSQDFVTIFNEIGLYITDLMIHPHGNHLIQKMLEFCTEEQRTVIIRMATANPGEFIHICCNIYGTRVIQKLIRSIKTEVQISLMKSALRFGVFDLITDSNGNHVIQHCLRCFPAKDKKFIFDVATIFCTDIAINEYGCFIIQKCIEDENSSRQQRQNLMVEISRNSLSLAQHPFGNYVVQCVIEQENYIAVSTILSCLRRHYVQLSMQKFSSHVVEKCLTNCPNSRLQIVLELITYPRFENVLQDPFANFVIKTAIDFTQGLLRRNLIDAIRPHEILRFDPCCRKIFSRYL